jgi:hypothetical protein
VTTKHNNHNDTALDDLDAQSDPNLARVRAHLDQAYAVMPAPDLRDTMDRAMERAMSAYLTARSHPAPAATPPIAVDSVPRLRFRLPGRLPQPLLRLLQVAAVVALVATGIASSVLLATQPASAQAIVRQAAAFHLAANEAAHLTYQVTLTGGQKDGLTGTADVWLQANASGTPVRSAQTLASGQSAKGSRPVGMVSRYIQDGQQVYAYDAGHNAILLGAAARTDASWIVPPDIFSGVSVAQDLQAIMALSPQQVQVLSPQTVNGVPVDVIQVTGWVNRPAQQTTFYFDRQSFLLRGFRIASTDPAVHSGTWQAWLSTDQKLAATAVPTNTYTLDAPAGARVEVRDLSVASFASVCHAPAMTKSQLQASHQTPLAVCQTTAPGMTADALIAALIAPAQSQLQSQLDAAQAAGQITPVQEAASLALLRAQLASWIASPVGSGQ